MNEYVAAVRKYATDNPPTYTRDANSILELHYYNRELKAEDPETTKEDFDDLYRQMHGMPLREMDRIVDDVCTLCQKHEKAGFVEGVKVGIQLEQKLTKVRARQK